MEAWFAKLEPRLGVPSEEEAAAGQGTPPEVRQAMEQVWSAALAAAQAEDALAKDRMALAADRQDLAQARGSLQVQSAAVAQRETLLQESLTLARGPVG